MTSNLQWFAVRVRPRCEKQVAEVLANKGYERFLPLHRLRRQWSDRVVETQLPLFPGYVFSRFDVQTRLPVLTTPGVLSIVSVGRTPQPVEDGEIDALQVLVRSRLTVEPWPYQHVGRLVHIVRGPLAGASGMLVGVKSASRLVVSVTLLQRSVAVEIPEDAAWPVSPNPWEFATL
jgi:transcription antitermination factor NusG